MKVLRRFPTQHGDFVHDVAFDYYGRRLATCSSDRTIKVWSLGADGQWTCDAQWSAHQGSVWKLSWGHPEYGQILASCSFDRTVVVWEEQEGLFSADGAPQSRWSTKTQLMDARESVNDVAFSPRHLGLRLATAAADGFVRVYEAVDVMNLEHWPLQHEFEAAAGAGGVRCLAWCQSRFHAPMLVVGGCERVATIWGYNDQVRQWARVATLNGHTDDVLDVCWAPHMGRSYHLLASAARDRTLRVWKVAKRAQAADQGALEVAETRALDCADSEVWRVEWNATGTTLAASCDDGVVRLWKADFQGQFVCVQEVTGDISSSVGSGGDMGGAGAAAAEEMKE